MSTRSYIAYKRKDGKYVASYCHSDGYLDGVGKTLYKHYDTFDKVKKLVDKGQMSSLGQYHGKPSGHSFDNPIDGYTVYYGRDRGEKDVGAMVVEDIDDLDNQYNYIFIDGKWFVKYYEGMSELSDYFNVKKRVRNPTIRSFLKGKHSKKTVFDFVYKKVLEQGKASLNEVYRCAYRSEDGCKCAAGHLVPDRDMKAAAVIDPSVNTGGIYSLMDALGIDSNGSNGPKVTFIRELQRAHDEAAFDADGSVKDSVFIKQYKKKMAEVAEKYEL